MTTTNHNEKAFTGFRSAVLCLCCGSGATNTPGREQITVTTTSAKQQDYNIVRKATITAGDPDKDAGDVEA
jgi:hypothetical protein